MPDTLLNTSELMTHRANSIDEEEGAERGTAAPRAGTAVTWEGEVPPPSSPSSGVSTPPAARPSTRAGAGRPRRQAVTGDLLKEQSRKDRGEGAGRQGATLLRRAGLGERACGTPRSVCARPRSPRYLLKKAAPVECSRIPNRGLRSWRLLNCFLLIPGA